MDVNWKITTSFLKYRFIFFSNSVMKHINMHACIWNSTYDPWYETQIVIYSSGTTELTRVILVRQCVATPMKCIMSLYLGNILQN